MKLHLGCGKKFLPNFIHIDLDDYPHIDYKSSISDLSMFENNSIELIYCCHSFEYFDREEAVKVLREWYRVLKQGGIIRLAVPNFEVLSRIYNDTMDINKVLGPLYGKIVIKRGKNNRILYHKTTYDFKSLAEILMSAGFKNIHTYDWQGTIHKDYDDFSQAYYPHLDKEHGTLISLNVEGTK